MKILLYPNPLVSEAAEIKDEIKRLFKNEEITEDINDFFDAIITIGGDGTILHAAKIASERGVAIAGVNVGRLGYLTSLEKSEIEYLPEIIRENNVSEHMLLDVYVNGELLKTIVNEAAIIRENYKGIAEITAEIAEGDSFSYLADGLIVSTPTGSTAYSFSAGGPIIEHTADNILLTPVCPHSLANRSLIISGDRSLKVTAKSRSKIILLLDGEPLCEIAEDTEIEIKKSKKTLKIYKKHSGNFYSVLKTKLL